MLDAQRARELLAEEALTASKLLATAEREADAQLIKAQKSAETVLKTALEKDDERQRLMDETIERKLQDSEAASRDIIARAEATARDILTKVGIEVQKSERHWFHG